MKNNYEIKNIAIQAIQEEAKAVAALAQYIDDDFVTVVDRILNLHGRVIVTGIGKSAIIAQKIVATLNSTGTPSIFMHAADAIHGDLGIIQQNDLIIAISKSGNTPEIKVLVPFLKQTKNVLVALVGNTDSYLAKNADYILNTTVEKEACPNNLAPTSSTTAQLAMGDALAVVLQECRDFTDKDFAKYHPGGALGKKLYLRVGDLSDQNGKPSVPQQATVSDIIITITQFRLGAVAVLDDENILGIITDGDIRRMLEKHTDLATITAADIMGKSPKIIDKDELAANALHIMRENNITQLLVSDKGNYAGVIHIQDLLKEGII
ncbi:MULTISPECIES: KpsF/GutQ family sugar-phosphate isomerase [Sphingobacterium]|uniref:Arabinose 5-phosphate isomerase KdsD n=2 Tax=Sphingobacterium multivorum TaxID=28454 RepID=A0A2X2JKK0_SPHMU|nr:MULTISPECIES: KpsF/GutQ family sugar-phosphate isomerase [Sphingobacterium]HAE69056.1 KpsF/GutQ family sugar-phosphate isomerase [Sphingobacterium sp.]OFV20817.1 D-arabinose 5-phosphate isomerase [Sphingobacterium sp. HMSC13C05]OJZ01132.1 MAG: D-arabinose 5-phosphate isomerase [Sphingobacterium sp. 40-24]QQT46016.1 KpsF/GutQ family sugar-phosphate isomerase [Sphingobacterium multivorum]QQT61345.1 KpsF/GutQ family sugar-phosphate isomerase [Sphingobacterium multivorum]